MTNNTNRNSFSYGQPEKENTFYFYKKKLEQCLNTTTDFAHHSTSKKQQFHFLNQVQVHYPQIKKINDLRKGRTTIASIDY